MASEGLHEPLELLDEATIDHHRAMTSLREELEAAIMGAAPPAGGVTDTNGSGSLGIGSLKGTER